LLLIAPSICTVYVVDKICAVKDVCHVLDLCCCHMLVIVFVDSKQSVCLLCIHVVAPVNWYRQHTVCSLVSEGNVRRSESSYYCYLWRAMHASRQGTQSRSHGLFSLQL